MVSASCKAQEAWSRVPIEERVELLGKWVKRVEDDSQALAEELTSLMGRPKRDAPRELEEFVRRSERVFELVPEAVARYDNRTNGDLEHFVQPEALGVVLVQAGWNYPYIIAAHSVLPALAVGNSVLLRHASQTPVCSLHLEKAFLEVGGPKGVLQALRLDRQSLQRLERDRRIAQVAVTGALPTEEAKPPTHRRRHIGLGLDLGGKDPAYVRADADFELAAELLVKAAFSNAGQSCCGVERIYIEERCFDEFVENFRTKVEKLKLGDPRDSETTLGPMVRFQAASAVYDQVNATIRQGAKPLLPNLKPERAYLSPQILVDVDHSMKLMTEETFGPAVGIMKVANDEEAVTLMNDTQYALGASVWTADIDEGLRILKKVKTKTSYVNHCDYLDPAIAFLGLHGSPRGFTLSHFGFKMLIKNHSYWVRR